MGNFETNPVKGNIFKTQTVKGNISMIEPVKEDITVKCPIEEMIKYFFKDYVIVWHDPNSNSKENQNYQTQLEEFCKVLTFPEWEKAKDYVQNTQAVCHVITSGTNGERLVKEIFEKENVCKVYVFCGNKEYHETWAKNYQKVLCVETRIETILNKIQQNLVEWLKNEDSLKINLPAFAPIFNDTHKSQMNSLHLFLKMIPNFNNREQAKEDFVSLSKRVYSYQGYMKDLEEFEQSYNDYNKGKILEWYTRDSFLFKVLNKSLRIATSDSIQYCHLPLKDIERAIKEQYQTKSKSFNGLLYRGGYLSDEEWQNLKENQNKEIEMHGFLSVSKERDVALNFTRSNQNQMVFITIIVPKGPNEEEQGFAEIEEFSQFTGEKEVLFNVRSRFTVLETEDETSEELPYRHLVLLYGAQGFRKFVTQQNPVEKVPIQDLENTSCCCHWKEKSDGRHEICFVPIDCSKRQTRYCKRCLDYNAAPFLCVGITNKTEVEIKGCLLMNRNQAQIPFYGYKCCNCQAKKQDAYFTCIDCSAGQKSWCEDCFDKMPECRESGHMVILETNPFSFWFKGMSPKELNHLKFQNDLVEKNNHLFQLGQMYSESQEYEKAIKYYSLYIQENKENNKDSNLASSYNNIGSVYDKQGEYKKALEYYLKSLDTYKSIYGNNHPLVATSYNNIGSVYDKQGGYNKALEYQFKSLDIRISVYGDNHPLVANSYHNIGMVYNKQGEYKKALDYQVKSLGIRKSAYGDNHPETATSYNNIGSIYYNQGDYKKALENYLKSLDIMKSVYGGNHPLVAAYYTNIGSVYDKQGEYMKALECYLKSVDIYKPIYGENHPEITTPYNNIGSAYYNQGEYQKALEYQFKSLNIRKSVYGDNHPLVANSYHNIGMVYNKQGEHIKALECYLKSLDIRKTVYGDNHPEIATSYNSIGSVYYNQGDYKKALEYYLKSLDITKSAYGDNHPMIASSYTNIGSVYAKQGEYSKALEYQLKSLDVYKPVYGDNHPLVGTSYNNIGSIYYSQGEYKKALEYYLKSLDIRKSAYGDNHPDIVISYNMIGSAYYNQGEYNKALEHYLKCLDASKSVYGDNHPQTISIQNTILQIQSIKPSNSHHVY